MLQDEDDPVSHYTELFFNVFASNHPKCHLSSFKPIQPHSVSNLYAFIIFLGHRRRYFEECWEQKNTSLLTSIVWRQNTETFNKITYFIPQTKDSLE